VICSFFLKNGIFKEDIRNDISLSQCVVYYPAATEKGDSTGYGPDLQSTGSVLEGNVTDTKKYYKRGARGHNNNREFSTDKYSHAKFSKLVRFDPNGVQHLIVNYTVIQAPLPQGHDFER
jgi:hypothetical protein